MKIYFSYKGLIHTPNLSISQKVTLRNGLLSLANRSTIGERLLRA